MRAREKAQRRERLTQLRRVVEATPVEQFNMQHWKCGTTACAAGHAASDPWFIRRGLRLQTESWAGNSFPECRGHTGYGALTKFFHMGSDEADQIFDPECYRHYGPIRPQHVLARIDKALASA